MIKLISQLLKNRQDTIDRILHRGSSSLETLLLLGLSLVLYAVFGFLIGASQSILQAFSSAMKLPILFFLTSSICFPTLYFFLSFLGARQDIKQLFSFIVLCNAFIALVLAAFAPVSFFFLITAYDYNVYKLINTLIFSVAGSTGIYLFYREMKKIMYDISAGPGRNKILKGLAFLRLWAIMFAFIGLQLSFTLSPFFGLPYAEFMFFTHEDTNFFANIINSIHSICNGHK